MEKLSLKKALKNDGLTIQLLIVTIIFCIMSVVFFFLPDELDSIGTIIVLLLWIAGTIGFIARILFLKTFKHENKVYKAVIVSTFVYRGNRTVKFEYTVNDVVYKKANRLFNNKYARQLMKGDEIEIYISLTNPKKAFIRDFYFEDINL